MGYVMVTEDNCQEAWYKLSKSRVLAFDIETQGLRPYEDEILLYALKGEDTPVYLILPERYPTRTRSGDKLLWAWGLFKGKIILAHNAVFEYMFMNAGKRRHKTDFLEARGFYDTALAEKVLTNGIITAAADLGTVVKKHTGVELPKELQKSWIGMSTTETPTQEQLEYAASDVRYLHEVRQSQLRKAQREGLMRTLRLEMQVLPAFAEMQLAGFWLNLEKHAAVLADYGIQAANAKVEAVDALDPLWQQAIATENAGRAEAYEWYDSMSRCLMTMAGYKKVIPPKAPRPFAELVKLVRKNRDQWKPKKVETINLGSNLQVLAALRQAGIEPVEENLDGSLKPSLDKNVLREWQHERLVQLYTAWAKPNKVVTTYGEALWEKVNPVTGRVHPSYNQIINSGRCSSSGPNGQNMPEAIRACFEAQTGKVLVVADAKNQEGRLAAALSMDKNLLQVFLDDKDWHSMTTAVAFPEKYASWADVQKDVPGKGKEDRASCKNANFSSIYGGTEYTLYQRGYVPSLDIGKRLMDAVYAFAPTLRNWSLDVAQRALDEGFAETIIGRKRYFRLGPKPRFNPEDSTEFENWRRARGGIRRAAMNHPVQGSGADVMKQAMIFLLPYMESIGGKQVAFVHDELVYEVPEAKAEEAALRVAQEMERAAACFVKVLPIPGEVHIGKVWRK